MIGLNYLNFLKHPHILGGKFVLLLCHGGVFTISQDFTTLEFSDWSGLNGYYDKTKGKFYLWEGHFHYNLNKVFVL